jgi:hypothetical protein
MEFQLFQAAGPARGNRHQPEASVFSNIPLFAGAALKRWLVHPDDKKVKDRARLFTQFDANENCKLRCTWM